MPNLEHLKEIVDYNLQHMDLSDENKENIRRAVRESPQLETPPKKRWWFSLLPVAAAAVLCAVLVPTLLSTKNLTSESAISPVTQEENLMDGILPHSLTSQGSGQGISSTPASEAVPETAPDVSLHAGLAAGQAEAEKQLVGEDTAASDFVHTTANFSIRLFQNSFTGKANTLLSPLSASLSLGMAANGANNDTKSQFLQALGGDSLPSPQSLNEQSAALRNRLQTEENKGVLHLANAIWYHNQGLTVKPDFLQTNADYFQAGAFQTDLTSSAAVEQINHWVREQTDGTIDTMIEKVNPLTRMYLINAVCFEMDWQSPFAASKTQKGDFYTSGGKVITASYMKSAETYLESEAAQGIKKPYADDRYQFVAILPKGGVSLSDYLQSLTGQTWLDLVQSPSQATVLAELPKFEADSSLSLKQALQQMGVTDCFDAQKADFSAMGTCTDGNLYLLDVLHKTHIQVEEQGSKAAASTNAQLVVSSAQAPDTGTLTFDHPFLYAILENETGLPLFLGAVVNPAA